MRKEDVATIIACAAVAALVGLFLYTSMNPNVAHRAPGSTNSDAIIFDRNKPLKEGYIHLGK